MIPQKMEIPGYDGRFVMTIDGDIVDVETNRIRKKTKKSNGIYFVTLNNRRISVSQILRMTYFRGETRPLWHKNKDSSDFRVTNIRPMTVSEYAKNNSCSHAHSVVRFRYNPENDVQFFRSTGEAARIVGVHKSSIQNWCRGKYVNSTDKYTYMYEDDYIRSEERR